MLPRVPKVGLLLFCVALWSLWFGVSGLRIQQRTLGHCSSVLQSVPSVKVACKVPN